MTRRRWLVGGSVGAVLLVGATWGADRYRAHARTTFFEEGETSGPQEATRLGPIPPEINESSGLAVSRSLDDVFWTHNDSGDEPRVYAMGPDATLIGSVFVANAAARDWESMDVGPCPNLPDVPEWCLYVADTGDNQRRRDSVRIYVIPEPDPAADTVEVVGNVFFTYSDGPLDLEAVAVAPDGTLAIVNKGRAGTSWLFTITAEEVAASVSGGDLMRLQPAATLPFEPNFMFGRQVTGGAIDAAGAVLALRTYTEIYFYEWPVVGDLVEAAPTCHLGLMEPGGEAVGFGPDGSLYLSSESPGSRQGYLTRIDCEGVAAPAPAP